MKEQLETIVALSHEFGGEDYVKGGGGNTSCKNSETLFVKPSGTILAEMKEDTFVALDRSKVNELYSAQTPADSAAREELVKNMMAAAITNDGGRPSVEAPLHNVFKATYVVHTHPCLVNGLTCAKDGEAACARLFPDALWIEYIDPGYTLCMEVRKRIKKYVDEKGQEPALLFLQNHGIFVAANSADEIRELYARVMRELKAEYSDSRVSVDLFVEKGNELSDETAKIKELFGDDAKFVTSCDKFHVALGPLSPDHMVYARAFPFVSELNKESVDAYRDERGYMPKIIITETRVYGIGTSQKNADLALELAQDGALIEQLAHVFGGVNYMSDRQREFIENWEVESYRQKQV